MTSNVDREILLKFLENFAISEALCRFLELKVLSYVLQSMDVKSPLLDIGCGNGRLGSALFRKIDVGIDLRSDAVKQAKLLRSYDALIVADARVLPFRDGAFNTIFSNSTLEHIPGVEKVVIEAYRVTNDKGIFIMTVPSEYFESLLLLPFKPYVRLRNRHLSHINLFDFKKWRDLLNNCGFVVVFSQLYATPLFVKLWDFIEIGYWLRAPRALRFLWNKILGNPIISSIYLAILRSEYGRAKCYRRPIMRGGGRLIIARKLKL